METTEAITCHLYNKDPIKRIKNELKKANLRKPIKVEDLLPFDQMHYLGTDAIDKAITSISIEKNHLVLDIGCGFGGPARYLAKKVGCKVHGIELQKKIADFACELNKQCNMQAKVEISQGDFLNFTTSKGYDRIISYLVFLHIQEKDKIWAQISACLGKKGRFYIEDFISLRKLNSREESLLKSAVGAQGIQDLDSYLQGIKRQGLAITACQDLSKLWMTWTKRRLEQYMDNLSAKTQLHGDEGAKHMLEFYQVVAKLFADGAVGGIAVYGYKPLSHSNENSLTI